MSCSCSSSSRSSRESDASSSDGYLKVLRSRVVAIVQGFAKRRMYHSSCSEAMRLCDSITRWLWAKMTLCCTGFSRHVGVVLGSANGLNESTVTHCMPKRNFKAFGFHHPHKFKAAFLLPECILQSRDEMAITDSMKQKR